MTRTAHARPFDVSPLKRYAPIVDDLDAFLASAKLRLPRVVWANPLLAPLGRIEAHVRQRCPEAEPVAGAPLTWRLPHDARPGNWPEYALGWLHGQEEAALWASANLDAKPGERVLDLCAAPGNKTAQLAILMENKGTLVANEYFAGRLAPLRFNLERLGVTNAVVTRADAAQYRGADGSFDHVLVDVPCTCEGTTRKGKRVGRDDGHRFKITQVQTGILRRAVRLTRRGGTIVYATCTYAPEENEAVVSAVREGDVALEPVRTPEGFRVSPGLQEWEGRRFRDDIAHAARVWPHHNDTGGFFVARMRRL